MMKMSMEIKAVRPKRVRASKIANDNEQTRWSKLPWRQRAMLEKRVDDLEWQLNYANMQLKNWRDLENGSWTALETLRDKARLELKDLIFG